MALQARDARRRAAGKLEDDDRPVLASRTSERASSGARGLAPGPPRPYLVGRHDAFSNFFSPVAAWRDLRFFLATRKRHELGFLALSLAVTALIIFVFFKDTNVQKPYERNIIYVEQWPITRTDAEISAQQKIDQAKRTHREGGARRSGEEAKQAEFKRLDDKLEIVGHLSDARWMAAALALAERGARADRAQSQCRLRDRHGGRVVGRGWTQPGGRPHAEAMALAEAGEKARGATVYVTLEPCAHVSPRGPACADLLIAAGVARVVIALGDPDPRTDGQGVARLRAAGIARRRRAWPKRRRAAAMAGFLTRQRWAGRSSRSSSPPRSTAASRSPRARAAGSPARRRARTRISNARGTRRSWSGAGPAEADRPQLDVRLPGLEIAIAPAPDLSSSRRGGEIASLRPSDIAAPRRRRSSARRRRRRDRCRVPADGLVDRLLLYRAPILIGAGKAALGDIGLGRSRRRRTAAGG